MKKELKERTKRDLNTLTTAINTWKGNKKLKINLKENKKKILTSIK